MSLFQTATLVLELLFCTFFSLERCWPGIVPTLETWALKNSSRSTNCTLTPFYMVSWAGCPFTHGMWLFLQIVCERVLGSEQKNTSLSNLRFQYRLLRTYSCSIAKGHRHSWWHGLGCADRSGGTRKNVTQDVPTASLQEGIYNHEC